MTHEDMNQLPDFLQSYENLNSYIRETLDELDNTSKGRSFARFVSKVIPISSLGDRFLEIELGPDSRDGGIDLTSISTDNKTVLYGQSKLTITKVEDIDNIISKFKNYFETTHANRAPSQLFAFPDIAPEKKKATSSNRRSKKSQSTIDTSVPPPDDAIFIIVTLSKIKTRILPDYEKSRMASKDFYNELKSNGKIIILDGPDVFPLAQSSYRKLYVIPSNVDIQLVNGFINNDNVYIGVVSAKELKNCYQRFGDALFLENIRLFLGYSSGRNDRENVNDSIRYTAENRPKDMLAKNNGITFRASKVTATGPSSLHLDQASIVNGCQTTMCIVQAPHDDACVLVKIVEVSDSWEIAKSANFQNKVDQIALEVARYMRPQALQQAASMSGFQVEDKNNSLYHIFDAIYQEKVQYDEAFYLFVGIFSNTPTNVLRADYNKLRNDLLEQFRNKDPKGDKMFGFLFSLYKSSSNGRQAAESKYQGESYRYIFQRFWKEGKPDYRSLITILAATGCVRKNIYGSNITLSDIDSFIDEIMLTISKNEQKFIRHYAYAYETIMTYLRVTNKGKTERDIQRTMYDDLRNSDFETLYDQICMVSDGRESDFK